MDTLSYILLCVYVIPASIAEVTCPEASVWRYPVGRSFLRNWKLRGTFSASRYAGRCVSSLGAHDGWGPDFALVWKKAAQNAYERGTGCIRLSVVTSLIPAH